MESIATKPLDKITASDIQNLITEGTQEGSTIEFKERLPAKGGGDDPWVRGAEQIGDKARNELLEEVVALANAHGGHLVIGIRETDDKPHRAAGIHPIPRCAALAEKLRLQARDCIEPQIPILSTIGVETDGQGGGIIIVRVPPSRMAPHRLRQTLECYYRRSDRSEKMSMREIQDLTLFRERGMGRIEEAFRNRQTQFEKWLPNSAAFGCRVTAIPTSPVYIQQLYKSSHAFPHLRHFDGRFTEADNSRFKLLLPWAGWSERPIVRGVRRYHEYEDEKLRQEATTDGAMDLSASFRRFRGEKDRVYIGWLLCCVANSLECLDALRSEAGLPELEYALEVQLVPVAGSAGLIWFFNDYHIHGNFDETITLPRVSVGPRSEFNDIMTLVMNDIRASAGQDAVRDPSGKELPIQISFTSR